MESFPAKFRKRQASAGPGGYGQELDRARSRHRGHRQAKRPIDPSLLDSIVPAMSDEKDPVRYPAAATVLRLSEAAAERKRKEAKRSNLHRQATRETGSAGSHF